MARIAFVACNKRADRYLQDPSFVYRCMNLAHGIKALGHEVWSGHLSALPWTQRWDVLVLHRPRTTWRFRATLTWLRHRGTKVLADVDDLIMDPAQAVYSPGVVNGLVDLATTQRQFAAHLEALSCMDGISVSTTPLAEEVRRILPGAKVAVVPNAVHHNWRDLPPLIPRSAAKVMTYLPGTRSHDRDFAKLVPALERVLHRHADAQLRVTGPLNFALNARKDQLMHQAKLPFEQYHHCFEGAAINLAPLEDSPFTRCKSALKVMEAAWWNVPTVCSNLPDAIRFEGAGALRASSDKDFEEHLEYLLGNDEALNAQSEGLRERVLPLADVMKTSSTWQAFALEQVQA